MKIYKYNQKDPRDTEIKFYISIIDIRKFIGKIVYANRYHPHIGNGNFYWDPKYFDEVDINNLSTKIKLLILKNS